MNVKGKYLKDESGNIISPITSTKTVYDINNVPIDEGIYAFSKMYTGQTFSRDSKGFINFTSKDSINGINLSSGTFTINKSGVYIVQIQCHFMPDNATAPYRLLLQCEVGGTITASQNQYNRAMDYSTGTALSGDRNINGFWLLNLNSSNTVRFSLYPIGISGSLCYEGGNDDVVTLCHIRRIGSYPSH